MHEVGTYWFLKNAASTLSLSTKNTAMQADHSLQQLRSTRKSLRLLRAYTPTYEQFIIWEQCDVNAKSITLSFQERGYCKENSERYSRTEAENVFYMQI